MSRHRNIRNMDYDDYYDDDYDDDDEETYRQQQQAKKKQQQAKNAKAQSNKQPKKKPNDGPAAPSVASGGGISAISSGSKKTPPLQSSGGGGISLPTFIKPEKSDESLRMLTGMGFPPDKSREALERYDGDVNKATNFLLSSDVESSPPPVPITVVPITHRPATTESTIQKATLEEIARKRNESIIQRLTKNQRSRLSMVVLGHVDAGKSTLMGQVLVQLGCVEKRVISKYHKQATEIGKASFALAWVMDEDESERERGVTMEVGTKFIATDKHQITVLDAPGHKDFIPAMISGAASADVGILVVAATPGEFEAGFHQSSTHNNQTGQTREHLILSRGLGVSQLIVAVNKLDASDPPWSEQRFQQIKNEIQPFLSQSGFNLKRVRFVPVSGLTAANVKEISLKNDDSLKILNKWYKGPTLLEAMDMFQPAQRNVDKPLRLILSDVYQEGKYVMARGRLTQGILQQNDKIAVLPIGDEATIHRIEHGTSPIHGPNEDEEGEERRKVGLAGDTVEISLNNIDIQRVTPGSIISFPYNKPPIQRKIQAKILIMAKLSVPIIRGAQAIFHIHSLNVPSVISKLLNTLKKDGVSIKATRPRVLTGGVSANVEITLGERMCVEEYKVCRSLGRFVLRRSGETIAVGVIEKIIG